MGEGSHMRQREQEAYCWNGKGNLEVTLGEINCSLGPVPKWVDVTLEMAEPQAGRICWYIKLTYIFIF